MNLAVYVQIELVPMIALILILRLSIREFADIKNIRRYRTLVIMVISILIVDMTNWILVNEFNNRHETTQWIIDIVYFLLSEIIAYLWFVYLYNSINSDVLTKRQKIFEKLSIIPLIFICAVILGSPWNKMIFYIDSVAKEYHRGEYNYLQFVFGFGYMLLASVLALIKSFKVELTEQKKQYRFLGLVVILPFIGGILQLIDSELIFLWPFTAAAAFLIYVDFQGHQISVDNLTSLNNRGSLEKYLQKKEHTHESDWYYLMLDIDRFKSINDELGHLEGDRALQMVAQTLRNVFGKTTAFISRYGGDEFVVIYDSFDSDEIDEKIKECNHELELQVKERDFARSLSISVGYAKCDEAESMRSLMKLADERMYECKRINNKR